VYDKLVRKNRKAKEEQKSEIRKEEEKVGKRKRKQDEQ